MLPRVSVLFEWATVALSAFERRVDAASLQEILAWEDPEEVAFGLELRLHKKVRWNQEQECLDLEDLSQPERHIVLAGIFVAEVNNGGLHQFFLNTSGNLWEETLSALEQVGAEEVSQMLRESLSVFPMNRPPKNRDERLEVLPDFEPGDAEKVRVLEALDNRFYANGGSISRTIAAYAGVHAEEISI